MEGASVTLRGTVRAVRSRQAATLLRLSLAFVFILFGGIKLWPASPADALVRNGVFFLPYDVFFPILGLWEVVIGVGLLHPRTVRPAVYLLIPQMIGTQLPLVTLSDATWVQFPVVPSAIGAYILKNWVLLSAGIVVLATVQSDTTASHLSSSFRYERIRDIERSFSRYVDRYAYTALRLTLAAAFVWFGGVTILGVGAEPELIATALAVVGSSGVIAVLYGALKASVGLTLVWKSTVHWSASLATVYMLVSLVPLLVFPDEMFLVFPIAPSFEGVAVLKDIVLVSGVLWVAARTTAAD